MRLFVVGSVCHVIGIVLCVCVCVRACVRALPMINQSHVTKCGSSRCETCKHMVEGDSLISNNKYNIVSPSSGMDCGTCNVVYLICCKKCGIQYIGKTTQTIRRRVNNHRNKLKTIV